MASARLRIFLSADTLLAVVGTAFAVLSVIINQQWAGERHAQAASLAEGRAKLLNEVVLVADTRREAVRLRDLHTLYTALESLAGDATARAAIAEEAVRAYEIALVSMAKHDAEADFDEVAFRFEALATRARAGDAQARVQIGREFVRLLGVVNRKHRALANRESEVERELARLRAEAAELTTMAVYLQVFGLIFVMLATIIGLKRIEFAISR